MGGHPMAGITFSGWKEGHQDAGRGGTAGAGGELLGHAGNGLCHDAPHGAPQERVVSWWAVLAMGCAMMSVLLGAGRRRAPPTLTARPPGRGW